MADSNEELERLLRAIRDNADNMEELSNDIPRLLKAVERWKKDLEETRPFAKSFKDFLAGSIKPLTDVREQLEDLDKAIENAVEANEDLLATELEMQREHLETIARQKNVKIGLANFAVGMGQVTKTLLNGAYDFVKDLQQGKEGTEAAGAAAEKLAEATGKLVENVGALAEAIGFAMIFIKGKTRLLGLALEVLGIGAQAAGPAMADLAKKGLVVLNAEVEKTKKGFRDLTGVGAEFAGGMTEMRQYAAVAGLDIAQFSAIVKASTENLSMMGVGITEASRRIAGVSGVLRNSDLGMQLRNLGLSVEEQGEMAALTASVLNASGKLRSMSDKEVAQATVAYTKDLKVLQGITGEDARKKLAKAREEALKADILAEAMRVGGPKAVERTIAALNSVPEYAKTGVLELMSTQGRAIGDFATNLNMVRNPKLRDAIYGFYGDITNASLSATDISAKTLRSFEEAGTYAREMPGAFKDIGTAVRLQAAPDLQGAFDMYNQAILYGTQVAKGTSDKVRAEVEGAAATADPLTRSIQTLDEEVQKLRKSLGTELTGAITGYSSALVKSMVYVDQFADTLKSVKEVIAQNYNITESDGKGGTIDWTKMLTGFGTAVAGAAFMGYTGGIGGVLGGGAMIGSGLMDMQSAWEGKADGGIARGPVSGYAEVLHGTEAVVPLPDGKSIPVTMTKETEKTSSLDTIAITASMNTQAALLNEILTTLRDGNNIQSGILQNSY